MVRVTASTNPGTRQFGLSLWLLFVSIFVHALLPTGSPFHRATGSAFSASTTDVSLKPTRKPLREILAQRETDDPEPPVGANFDAQLLATPIALPLLAATLIMMEPTPWARRGRELVSEEPSAYAARGPPSR
jgi:hypothetical protein